MPTHDTHLATDKCVTISAEFTGEVQPHDTAIFHYCLLSLS